MAENTRLDVPGSGAARDATGSQQEVAAFLRCVDSSIDVWMDVDNKVVAAGEDHGVRDIAIAVVNETAKAATLIVLYAVSITYTLDITGGMIMVTARYLTDKFVEPLREQLREEGEARANRKWMDWNNRRIKAEDEGVPFDESPPTPPTEENLNGNQTLSE